jgi:cell division protein FtsX
MKLVVPEPFIYIVALILLGIGMIVGMFGSLRAVRKYLKI